MKFFIRFLLLICFLHFLGAMYAQSNKVTLSGYVKDANNGEALAQASVVIQEAKTGAYTNEYGFYSITLSPGTYTVKVSYLGYETLSQEISLVLSQTLNVELGTKVMTSEEVVILGESENDNITNVEMSTVKLDISQITRMPQLMGEVDIIRSIQLLPGVSTVGEGATGFNVRGGNIDQNLILLDESPVYNSSHLLGFFSVFNADAIKGLKLYKGGIPANYGGRLSSVLDVRQKEGNNKNFAGTGGIGLISSRLTLEGPIVKDRASFMVAGRRSYMDLFLKLSSDPDLNSNTLYFYDLNAKVNYKLGEKDQIFLSGYTGDDVFQFQDDFRFRWGNQTGTLRWNHLFNDRLFSNFTVIHSNYRYELGVPDEGDNTDPFKWTSRIINYNAKADLGWYVSPKYTLEFGVSGITYAFKPGEVRFLGNADEGDVINFEDFVIPDEHALESGAYISAEHKVNTRLSLQYGLRYSNFSSMGKGEVYVYDENLPFEEKSIIDTLYYDSWEKIKTFDGWEPRFSLNYTISEKSAIKASYNRLYQYIHLVSNTTSATPLDVWKPSGRYVKPARVDQWVLGYFRNFKNNAYQASLELYYKDFVDLLDYKDGADLLFNKTIETELLSGEGRAYGLELMLEKKKGDLTGWISYTLSRTERKIPGINKGEYFPSNYDKLHDLSIVANYRLSKKWDASANFAYMTGRPVTYPDARYVYEGLVIPNYGNRNGSRTPDYHRIDLSANYQMSTSEQKFQQSLSFGVYNLYGRNNPFSIFFRQNADRPTETEAVQLSIFAAPIPYITWNFNF